MTTKKKYNLFLIIGLISLINIMTRGILSSYLGGVNSGAISLIIGLPIVYLVNSQLGSFVIVVLDNISGFASILLVYALFLRRELKKEENAK